MVSRPDYFNRPCAWAVRAAQSSGATRTIISGYKSRRWNWILIESDLEYIRPWHELINPCSEHFRLHVRTSGHCLEIYIVVTIPRGYESGPSWSCGWEERVRCDPLRSIFSSRTRQYTERYFKGGRQFLGCGVCSVSTWQPEHSGSSPYLEAWPFTIKALEYPALETLADRQVCESRRLRPKNEPEPDELKVEAPKIEELELVEAELLELTIEAPKTVEPTSRVLPNIILQISLEPSAFHFFELTCFWNTPTCQYYVAGQLISISSTRPSCPSRTRQVMTKTLSL